MSRELKFRVWDNIDYMSSPFTLEDVRDKNIDFINGLHVMQYTGLKDKNGKEIYEGDIMRGRHQEQQNKNPDLAYTFVAPVEFSRGGFRWYGKNFQSGDTKEGGILYQFMWLDAGHWNGNNRYYEINEIEVIGNIYQNPELLNQ